MQISTHDATSKSPTGERVVWLLFCATSVYLALLQPYVVLIPGERGNVFAGLLCAFTLAAALIVARSESVTLTRNEILISLTLLVLALISGLMSSTSQTSFIRVLVLMSSGLGGFWCARILLSNSARQRTFLRLCVVILVCVLFLSWRGFQLYGKVDYYVYYNPHQVINMAALLLVGPLALISWRKPFATFLGVLLTGIGGIALFLAAWQEPLSGALVPLGVVLALTLMGIFRAKTVAGLLILLVVAAMAAAYFMTYLGRKDTSSIEFQAYRVESYPFSWHVVTKHPWLGVGLRTPREELVADYEVRHPALTKEEFARQLRMLVTPENAFLALLTGLGAPFFLLYICTLGWLLAWLVAGLFRPPPDRQVLRPWVLFVPLLGSLLHSLTTDTFMLAQINWYLHLLLGLIRRPEAAPATHRVSWESVGVRLTGLAGAVAAGIVLGTSSYFSPEKLPTTDEIHAYLKDVPLIKLLYYEKKPDRETSEKVASRARSRADQQPYGFRPDTRYPDAFGNLLVNIEGYKGVPETWAVMVILDNSKHMAEEMSPGGPTRQEVALKAIELLVNGLPAGSKVALRAFSSDAIARKKSREIPLRVSRLIMDWTATPATELSETLKRIPFRGDNNVCAATHRSIQRDLGSVDELVPRVVLLTDGSHECTFDETLRASEKERRRGDLKLDVIAIDMPRHLQTTYSKLAAESGGLFLNLAQPIGADEKFSRYLAVLQSPKPQPLEVTAGNTKHNILPGENFKLPPGSYTITLPGIEGLAPSSRSIKDVKVVTGETTVLNLRAEQGKLEIQE